MLHSAEVAPSGSIRLGVLGGSFDPIHNGHLVAASEVAKALDLDRVLFVPAGNQWQKTQAGSVPASAEHRLEMTRLAIAGNPLFAVSSVDVDRAGATYTVDTLTDIKRQFPNAELFFILGTDAVAGIESWKDCEKLFDLATFVVVSRPGFPAEIPSRFASKITQVSIPALDLSSTSIRDRKKAGKPIDGAVPAGVITYIKENILYKEAQ